MDTGIILQVASDDGILPDVSCNENSVISEIKELNYIPDMDM